MIPKKIHQVWLGPLARPDRWLRTWPRLNPSWEYQLWTEETIPWPLVNQVQFDASPTYSGKSDVLRHELLLRFGGLYLDADLQARRPLDEDLRDCGLLTVYANEQVTPGRLAPGILGAVAGHPIVAAMVEAIGRLAPQHVAATPPYIATGPVLFTEVAARHGPDPRVRILPSHTFLPVHHTGRRCTEAEHRRAYADHFWGSTHARYG